MLTRNDIPKLLLAGLQTVYMQGLKSREAKYPKYTTKITSTKASEVYGWLGSTPELQEWRDERAPKELLENGFTLVNKDYEASIAVDRNALADDQYGQVKVRVQQMGSAVNQGYDRKFIEVLEAGDSELCYDGQNYFDTDHSEGKSGIQTNLYASGKALSVANAQVVISNMKNLKDDQGKVSAVTPTTIVVPTGLEWKAREIFDPKGTGDTNANNVLKGVLEVEVDPYLSNDGGANAAYYIMDLSQPVNPFIYQERKKPEFVALDGADDYANFMRKTIYYGVDARFAFGYGDWRLCTKAKG